MRTWLVERRKRTRHLIELGGLVVKAGVVDLTGDNRAMIYGALLWMADSPEAIKANGHARYGPQRESKRSRGRWGLTIRMIDLIWRFGGDPNKLSKRFFAFGELLVHEIAKRAPFRCDPVAVTQEDVEEAVRTILAWIGEDPGRERLSETPLRVARAYKSYFSGYDQKPEEFVKKTFEETAGYDEMVLLRKIPFQSHCEHHMAHRCAPLVMKRNMLSLSFHTVIV